MLVSNLLAEESTAGETRVRLMSRSGSYKGTASRMLGPRMQVLKNEKAR